MRELFRHIVCGLATAQIEVDAPLCVAANVRVRAGGRWMVHLHNSPGSSHRHPSPQKANFLHTPGEINPVYDLAIRLNGAVVRSAVSGISGSSFELCDGGKSVRIGALHLHDVVLLEVEVEV